MKTEEKAKAYDEALNWMRELYPGLHGATKEDAEHYFPELRESEDERARKGMIRLLESEKAEGMFTHEARLSWIAYLEKQKEHSMSAEEVLTRAGLKPYKDGNQWCILAGDNIQEGICGFGDTIEDALYEFLKEVLDLQKEQKPVVTHGETYHVDTLGTQQVIAGKMPQKPAEWSEEDTLMLTAIIQTLEKFGGRGTTGMQIDWLKSLRPQPKKEWTIEDAKPGDILHTSSTASSKTFIFKGIRNDEHGSVECFCCYDSEDGFVKGEEELIGWKTDKYRLATPEQCIELGRIMGKAGYIFYFETNQLRQLDKLHWKPSEEQMDALKRYSPVHHPDVHLVSLYDDLKKLM